ncbi:ATP-dependent DNA ligase [Microbacterium sp. AISO3]|uniref:DUF7882 family protein n=1 Tax=unclassified Microbacterium TaxID=2609290 RepID=UPI00038FE4F9|nr:MULTISPECIES: hypothetical protein [unclassified Microbacterium]OWP22428.1 ATP-dependent DNA ligase [Microbacterium sp. AISO3]POX66552.1 ATP-dependent DNA ligase [Microbacterium sp. Ru50]GAD35299.1 ATP-dependent DNA ligase [Microbacterium sp. TS-1]
MGRFIYGNGNAKVEIEDRTLAHLQQVVGAKLRRSESFFFTWKDDPSVGGGRRAVWIHPGADLEFKFHGGREPQLSREWLTALTTVASSPTGLYVVPEPAPRAAPLHSGGVELYGERIGG